jgi:hypothetical protein
MSFYIACEAHNVRHSGQLGISGFRIRSLFVSLGRLSLPICCRMGETVDRALLKNLSRMFTALNIYTER